MTEPRPDGPYDNSIRSDSSSGLGGLWTQLAAIAAGIGSLPALLAAVQQIRDDVRKVVGEGSGPALWPGLTTYLDRSIAGVFQGTHVGGPTLWGWLNDISIYTVVLRNGLVGSGAQPTPAQVALILAQAQQAVDHLNAIRGFSNEQSSVLGFIGDAPAGKSIKALLEEDRAANVRAADCCEGGGEEPTDPPTNERPSPETRCAVELGSLRASNLVAFADANVAPDQLYMVEFSPISGVSAGRFQNGTGNYTGGVTDLPIVVADVDMSVCVDWNYTNADNPAQATFYRFNPANLIGSGTNTLITTQTDDQNSTQVFAIPAGEAFAFSIRVLQGNQVPGLNIWVAWDEPA